MKDKVIYTDGYKLDYRVCPHEGKVYRKLTQPDRDLILNRNVELRKNKGALNDLSFGRQMFSVPFEDYEHLKRKHPELRSNDTQTRSDFWIRFLKSPESLPYRVQDNA